MLIYFYVISSVSFSFSFSLSLFVEIQPARHTKLEKADILEMTVKYLQTLQRNQINAAAASVQNDPTVYLKFKAGFSDCRNEVVRYISQIDGVDASVKQRLMGHLNNCVTGIQQQVATPYNTLSSSSSSPSEYGLHLLRIFNGHVIVSLFLYSPNIFPF